MSQSKNGLRPEHAMKVNYERKSSESIENDWNYAVSGETGRQVERKAACCVGPPSAVGGLLAFGGRVVRGQRERQRHV
jgi:hypothetical protein